MFKLAQAILFMLPAETAHHVTMSLLKVLYKFGFVRNSAQSTEQRKVRGFQDVLFDSGIGLAAGFDKNATIR